MGVGDGCVGIPTSTKCREMAAPWDYVGKEGGNGGTGGQRD